MTNKNNKHTLKISISNINIMKNILRIIYFYTDLLSDIYVLYKAS